MKYARIKVRHSHEPNGNEWYTPADVVNAELSAYPLDTWTHTVVHCPADTPNSEIVKWFAKHFDTLGLARLVATSKPLDTAPGLLYVKDKHGETLRCLKGSGDFLSPEVLTLLEVADVVVTNPPFERSFEFIGCLVSMHKKFSILGLTLSATNSTFSNLLIDKAVHIGHTVGKFKFIRPDGTYKSPGTCCWWTNIDTPSLTPRLIPHAQDKPLDTFATFTLRTQDIPKFLSHRNLAPFIGQRVLKTQRCATYPSNWTGLMTISTEAFKWFPHEWFDIVCSTRMCQESAIECGYTPGRQPFDLLVARWSPIALAVFESSRSVG